MRIQKMFPIAIALLLLIPPVALAQMGKTSTPTYDAVKDFSIQSNPNGVWSYGWESTLGSTLNLYTVTDTTSVPGMSAWLRSGTFPLSPQYLAHNDTDKQICRTTWCDPTTYLLSHPGPKGELSILRWTAPSSGTFLMQVNSQGLDCCTTSTYFHVLLNSTRSFLKAPINSYQWPLSFHPRAWTLSAGDTVDFIVDWGKDGDFHSDSTGVEVKVWNLGQH